MGGHLTHMPLSAPLATKEICYEKNIKAHEELCDSIITDLQPAEFP